MEFTSHILKIEPKKETEQIAGFVRDQVQSVYRRSGIVVGLSGGIDSAVMAELCIRALGKDTVYGVILPEKESNPVSSRFARAHADKIGIRYREVDITSTVDSVYSYNLRDNFIKELIPEYTPGASTT